MTEPLVETDPCPNCEKCSLSWNLTTRLSDHAALSGQLRASDVIPQLTLGCDYCSETVRVIEEDREIRTIISAAHDRGYTAGLDDA